MKVPLLLRCLADLKGLSMLTKLPNRSNLKNWEMVVKHGPDSVEQPSVTVERPDKPATRLRRSKNHSKKGRNLGKDRFPTHKVPR